MTSSCSIRAIGNLARVMPRYSIVRVSLLANGSASAVAHHAASRTLALVVVVYFFVSDDCNIADGNDEHNWIRKLTVVNFSIRQKKRGRVNPGLLCLADGIQSSLLA